MAPRPRNASTVTTNSHTKQADAVSEITSQWLYDTMRTHVFGESNTAMIPTVPDLAHLADYLRHLRFFYKNRQSWEDRDEDARNAWRAAHFLITKLPGFCRDEEMMIAAMQGWERFGSLSAEDLATRDAAIAGHKQSIATMTTAAHSLTALVTNDLTYGPFSEHCAIMPPQKTSWHDYALEVAESFVETVKPLNPTIGYSNEGPAAKFVFHLIPTISGEEVANVSAVGRHIHRRLTTKKTAVSAPTQ